MPLLPDEEGSTNSSRDNNTIITPEGAINDIGDLSLTVVDRKLFNEKILSTTARLSDVDNVHKNLIRTEDGVNRLSRVLNRRINQNSRDIKTLTDETSELSARINTLNLEQNVNNNSIVGETPLANRVAQPALNTIPNRPNRENRTEEAAPLEINPEGFHKINMLSAENFPSFTIFSGSSVLDFERWARKFNDLIDCNGGKWDEKEKIARLKACLDGKPRRIFEKISEANKTTLAGAIKKIHESLDTTQNRELTYKALSVCRQKEGESVDEFSARLIPLVEASTVDQTGKASEEILCRLFLEKLTPNLQFLTRTLTGPNRKDFDTLQLNAHEAEIMLSVNPKPSFYPICQVEDNTVPQFQYKSPPNYPNGNFKTWAPTNPNRQPLGRPNRFQNSGNRSWQSGQQYSNRPRNPRNTNWNRGPQQDKRWNNRPVCNYCKKVGHLAFNCFKRRSDFTQPRNSIRVLEDQNRILQGQINQIANSVQKLAFKQTAEADTRKINSIQKIDIPSAAAASKLNSTEKNVQNKISSWEPKIGPKFLPIFTLLALSISHDLSNSFTANDLVAS
ncbi:unnamed protein product [Meloidogyne enterolobii]|uniref:Uncharacterized protein n=1 Tax=Meloidogyne enterolobii TaxID=390850 RepID=A0ACB0ZT22_MELEN